MLEYEGHEEMISTIADIESLLEIRPEQFIPKAYEAIIGYPPGIQGIIHYAQRSKSGFPRLAILSEMYSALGEQVHEDIMLSNEVNKIFKRCFFVRNLPLGKMRWWLLPRVKAKRLSDRKFNWLVWAGDYIERNFSLARQSTDQSMVSREELKQEFDLVQNLEQKVETLLFEVQRLKETIVQNPEHHDRLLVPESIDLRSVSYEARQTLFNLYSALSK